MAYSHMKNYRNDPTHNSLPLWQAALIIAVASITLWGLVTYALMLLFPHH